MLQFIRAIEDFVKHFILYMRELALALGLFLVQGQREAPEPDPTPNVYSARAASERS